jgi:hypothetical protein
MKTSSKSTGTTTRFSPSCNRPRVEFTLGGTIWGNHENRRQKRTVPLWKRQEIQEVSWRRNAQVEFKETGRRCFFGLPAFRAAWNFTVGSRSDKESSPPVAYRSRNARSSSFPHTVARLATKAANTSDTLEPTRTPPGIRVGQRRLSRRRRNHGIIPVELSDVLALFQR